MLISAEFRKQARLARAYWPNIAANQLLYIFIFFLLSGLANVLTGGQFDRQSQLAFLIGYLVWRVGTGAMEEMVLSIASDAQWGTLEQVWSSGASLPVLLLARTINYVIFFTLRAIVIAAIIFPFLRYEIPFAPAALLVYALTLIGTVGIAYLLIGLHLIYKNVHFLANFFAFLLFFLTGVLTPLDNVPTLYAISRLLPLSAGVDMLRSMLVDGQSLVMVLNSADFWMLLLISAIYLGIGLATLRYARKRSLQAGSLAHY